MSAAHKNRVLIIGLPKSGTTILTYRISAALDNAHIYFEPGKAESLSNETIHKDIFESRHKSCICKSLFVPIAGHNIEAIEKFYNRKIWIYRDPRDWMISKFMYRWKNLGDTDIKNHIAKLQSKEQNPSELAFFKIPNKKFVDRIVYNYEALIDAMNALSDDWLILKYEDFVDNQLSELNAYLGVDIDPSVEVDKKHSRVIRSKTYGNWKLWFNEEDVVYFQERLNPILEKLNYTPLDWEIENPEQINPELGSEYIRKLYNAKNQVV